MSVEIEPKRGEVAFKWFNNYAGLTIRTPSKIIVIDPGIYTQENLRTSTYF